MPKRKRKILSILLMPVTVCISVIGYSLYYTGKKRGIAKANKTKAKPERLHFTMAVAEEEEYLTHTNKA